jgi:hypothetical protein
LDDEREVGGVKPSSSRAIIKSEKKLNCLSFDEKMFKTVSKRKFTFSDELKLEQIENCFNNV